MGKPVKFDPNSEEHSYCDANTHAADCECFHCELVEAHCPKCGKVHMSRRGSPFCSIKCIDESLKDYWGRNRLEPELLALNAAGLADLAAKIRGGK